MQVFALTGGIGSGKSEAAKIFAELGVPIIDLDVISHQLTAPGMPLLANIYAVFGDAIFNADGSLNRVSLRKLVFDDDDARKQLNAILHPAIYDAAIKQAAQHTDAPYLILAIPLLYEDSPYLAHIHRILVIDCDEKTQIARVQARSQLTEAEILQIIRTQTPRETLLSMANDVIENNGSVAKLREKILQQHEKYINTCIVSKTIS